MLLIQSASNGNFSLVKRLLNSGCNIDLKADDGSTALHCAARTGQIDVLQLLISHGADVNVKNRSGHSPLSEAAIGGHLGCVTLLLEAGTDMTKLWFDDYRSFSSHAIRTGKYEIAKTMLAAVPKTQRHRVVNSLASASAANGKLSLLQYLHKLEGTKIEFGYDVQKNSRMPWPLHQAVRNGHLSTVEYMLPLYGRSETLFHLLRMAAKKGWADICKVLLAHNPAVEHNSSLYLAAQYGHLPVVKVLLEHQDVSVAEVKLDLRRPILAALWNDRLEILRHLFSHYTKMAQLAGVQCDGLSRVELVKYLIRSKWLEVNESFYGYSRLRQHGTLLHLAVEHSDLDLARYVVQHESFDTSILKRDHPWESRHRVLTYATALDLAKLRGQTEIASLLIAHGAINHNIAPKGPPQTEQIPAQPLSPSSDSDIEMHEDSDYESGSDLESLQAQKVSQDISDTPKKSCP